jgi:hypothetical protein
VCGRLTMTHVLHISDERYCAASAMAAGRGQTPEQLIDAVLDEAWERECARYDATFHDNPSWQQAAQDAESGRLTPGRTYESTEEFFRALGASGNQLEVARKLDVPAAEDGDADV